MGDSTAGTLLLADADTLSPQVQAELARLLGVRGFPCGIIATSQQPLVERARQGKYREDLAHLLSTLVIELPPLSGRRGDLPLLLQLFLEENNAGSEKQLSGFTPDAIDCLAAYRWPGNVDELVRLVREAHQKAEGPRIGLGDLPRKSISPPVRRPTPDASRKPSSWTDSLPAWRRNSSSVRLPGPRGTRPRRPRCWE